MNSTSGPHRKINRRAAMGTKVHKLSLIALAAGLVSSAGTLAADTSKNQSKIQEPIYGSQLMTPDECIEHRTRCTASKPRKSGRLTGRNTIA
jgi:hypothetical protein